MFESIFNILAAIFVDLPKAFLYLLVTGGIAYIIALILIGFPVSIWEAITKKKANSEKEDRIIRIIAICLFILLMLMLLLKEVL